MSDKNTLNQTPRSDRLHIAIFGKRNAGKSSLINAITNQNTAIVSDTAGTTADPVYKAMEIHPLGPCVLIDTAGFDDVGMLGELRIQKTDAVTKKTDIAIMVFADTNFEHEKIWINKLKKLGIPILAVINKIDAIDNADDIERKIKKEFSLDAIKVSSINKTGIGKIKDALVRIMPEGFCSSSIAGHLINNNDVVLLVMPQDIQAPKGRLILPQVQTIRDLLDGKAVVLCCTTDCMQQALDSLKAAPKLIITDSQVFDVVYKLKPEESLLTSFSVLFARHKGDIDEFVRGAAAIDALTSNDRVLIAEACTHAPLTEDIGRVKLPRLLRKHVGESLSVDVVSGNDFPDDLSPYSLVIHCGACMFNRRYVMSRIESAKNANVPITNYGVALAKLNGILDKIETY